MKITPEMIRQNEDISVYIACADESLKAMGYTEHSFAHVIKVAEEAKRLLTAFGADERTQELGWIAGYMHDIGNVVNRVDHAQSGAMMTFRILDKIGMSPKETAIVVTAIGNHDESTAYPVNEVAAALILADKTDVRRSRVRGDINDFDIHDRVNYAVTTSRLEINKEENRITLHLTIDDQISSVADYFEIFLGRMQLSRKAAKKLGADFSLIINGQTLM
ncbi:MAG: HD domain-containing protein [Clostridiales bacterium]|nr:HD domain-containing protein [Clostridiales bacterium]